MRVALGDAACSWLMNATPSIVHAMPSGPPLWALSRKVWAIGASSAADQRGTLAHELAPVSVH